MIVESHVCGYSPGKTKDATVGVVLRHGAAHHINVVDLGQQTKNAAELLGIKYILLAVKEPLEKVEITINTSNPYAFGMFQKTDGIWNNSPKKNLGLIKEIRNLLENYKNFKFNMLRKDELISKLSEIQKKRRSVSEAA